MKNRITNAERVGSPTAYAKLLITRRAILLGRVYKLNIIRNDIYPENFNRVTRLIISNERKLSIIDKLLGW
jgi:hypothetical protein